MIDRDIVAAARHALTHLENQRELARNPLLPADHAFADETLRSAVLRALETMRPPNDDAGVAHRGFRLHAILVRCDLRREAHDCVARALALSRRQFYRERHAALLRLGGALQRELERARAATVTSSDLGDAAEAYIEALRSAGQHRSVWQEATAAAAGAAGDGREIDLWMVASEAARFLANTDAAEEALDRARDVTSQRDSYWRTIWIASGEMNLQWVAGDAAGARATFERALRAGPDERALHGKEAILSGIMLSYAAAIEMDCGRWEAARSLLARASPLMERDATAARRQSLQRLSAVTARLSALLAQHAGSDDRARSIADARAALDAARATGQLGNVAMSAVQYASASYERDPGDALGHATYGLEIARRFYPGDRLVELTLEALPVLLCGGDDRAARRAVAQAQSPGLGRRDRLFLELAESKIAFESGDLEVAAARAENASAQLFGSGIDAWACDAALVGIEASARLGYRRRARRRLSEISDALGCARAATRRRARRVGTLLALPA
jgi:tetratricopeptide (TPR) repeat protein